MIQSIMLGIFIAVFSLACSSVAPKDSKRNGLLDRLENGDYVSDERLDTEEAGLEDYTGLRDKIAQWQWPLRRVEVTSPFGKRKRNFHEGVDLRAPTGTPVYAVDRGVVAYVGSRIRGYGRMVVLLHPNGLYSLYAHHSKNFVKRGQTVRQGQKIALSGRSGRVKGPHLHFEIRNGTLAFDPIRVMPEVQSVASRTKISPHAE